MYQDCNLTFAPVKEASASVIPLFSPRAPLGAPGAARLRVSLVGTYVPRKCGIATFTSDVVNQLSAHEAEVEASVYAMDAPARAGDYPAGVALIDPDSRAAYLAAARAINESGADALWLQHEFGIFGGADGDMVLDLVDAVAAPLVVTFHTVLSEPSDNQRRVVEHLLSRASRVMVMSRHGRDLLVDRYKAPPALIEVIPHGAPDRPFGREDIFKALLGHSGRHVLMTFGLLGPGKGLEQVIAALPAVVSHYPDLVYRIVGATHPTLVASQGESYREGLMAQAEALGVADHIVWDNRFLDTEELLDQLEACDIYLTPYPGLQQATSGTLSYAVALGKAVVSTPYVHARELLAGDVGVLVAPGSSEAIAAAVLGLLGDPARMAATKARAYAAGRETIWPEFASATAAMLRRAVVRPMADLPLTATPGLSGFLAMCDGTGIMQHAIGIVPDRRHGYCLDDNARALMLMNHVGGMDRSDQLQWSSTFASFVQHAWNQDGGHFRNFMSFERTWLEDKGSDDSNGRALWVLGDTHAHSPFPDLAAWALEWFDVTLHTLDTTESPRALAFGMLGAALVLRGGEHAGAEALLQRGGDLLHRLLAASRRPDWAWFEAVLGYDNPRLPQALIAAGEALQRSDWTDEGLATLAWIAERQTSPHGLFRPVGSESFGLRHDQRPFDQQPLEAQAAIEACAAAHAVDPSPRWLAHARAAYAWFFGANDRGALLADITTGRCRDGVTPRGANGNCGAESILALQLSHATMKRLGFGRDAPSTLRDVRNELAAIDGPTGSAVAHP
jgi:glycosyltransferase involved in cell wall biosynthesis